MAHTSESTTVTSEQSSLQRRQRRQRPPGPPWYTALSNTFHLLKDTLGTLEKMRERYGDVVLVPIASGCFYAIFHPDGAKHVLQTNHMNYNKDATDYDVVRLMLGKKSLLTNDGDSWRRERRLIQPAFHRQKIAAFATFMTDMTLTRLKRWEKDGFIESRKPLALAEEMSSLTMSIVSKATLGANLSAEIEGRAGQAFRTANNLITKGLHFPALLTMPTPQRCQFHAAMGELDAIVKKIIREHHERSDKHNDLLDLLLQMRDEETGESMTDQQLRDEVVTFLFAGHETTANMLSWAFYLLAQHPEVQTRLREEYRRVLNGRSPQIEDLPQLSLTRMVIEETMRLYPPVWAISRGARGEDEINGYSIPKGARMGIFTFMAHRHPAIWERPNAFEPERFAAGAVERPRFAYYPFGGGPRLCIGNQFALYEAQLILPIILSSYELRLVPGTVITPKPLITLGPGNALLMTVHLLT